MSSEVHIKKAQPIDIHIVSGQPMSNVEQNREKENKETSRSPHLIKKGLYRLFKKQGRLCPVVLVLHVAELDGLTGDLNLLEVV